MERGGQLDEAAAGRKGAALDLELPSPSPRVMGDHRRLEQVLLNLLSNANKFSPTGADHPDRRLRPERRDGGRERGR